jgi:hypothetical protein
MALDASLLLLRKECERLGALLIDLRKRAGDDCPDSRHYLIERLNDAIPVVEGWLRKANRGAKMASRAIKHMQLNETRLALTRSDQAIVRLRKATSRDLAGRNRLRDLEDLSQRKSKTWKTWMAEVLPTLRDVRLAVREMARHQADCWRELASQFSTGIVINNLAVGKQLLNSTSTQSKAASGVEG